MGLRLVVILVTLTMPIVARAERREMSLADAIAVALAHNGDIYIAKADAAIAAEDVTAAGAVFVPRLIADARVWSDRTPGTATGANSALDAASGSIAVIGQVPTGATYNISVATVMQKLADATLLFLYEPAYTSTATISLTQPLLRNAGGGVNRAPIVVAARQRQLTEQQLRAQLQKIVGDVAVAYWTLVLAYKEVEARAQSVKLAQDQLADSTRLVKLGSLSELDIVEARAGVARQKQTLLRAQRAVLDAELALRQILVGDGAWKPDDTIVPSDDAAIEHAPKPVEEHVQLAFKNRPDIAVARHQILVDQAGLIETGNAIKPALDLIATAGFAGFAGKVVKNDPSLMFTPDPGLDGGLAKSYGNLAKGNFVVSVGLRLELPFSNREARAKHARQQHVVERARIAEEALVARVRNEVQATYAQLNADAAIRTAADQVVTDNEKLLVGMRKRFAGGQITSFDVLRVTDELARSQIEVARSRAAYRVSLARLATADGTLLQSLNIKLSSVQRKK